MMYWNPKSSTGQIILLAIGLAFIAGCVAPIYGLAKTGVLEFHNHGIVYGGGVAAVALVAFLAFGAGLVITSVRNLKRK